MSDIEIIRNLVKVGCLTSDDQDEWCHFCEESTDWDYEKGDVIEKHARGCPYVAATKRLEEVGNAD